MSYIWDMKHIGIADCHGLESFIPAKKFNAEDMILEDIDNSVLQMMLLRTQFNPHRHAILYRVDLSKEDALVIYELLEEGDYVGALKHMKNTAIEVELADSTGRNKEKTWRMIPNPDLDPYHH